MEEPLVDRRIFERIEGDFTGWYSVKDNKELAGEFLGVDLSGSGIRVRSVSGLPENRILHLDLNAPVLKTPIQETARVAWQREVQPGRWQAGLKFYQPRLAAFWPLVELKTRD